MQTHPYRETFRKHRILYCLPPLIAAVAVGVLAFGAAKKYQSSASLWVDNGPLSGSSLNTASGSQPSSSEATFLNELLATKSFALAVADGSALKSYIAAQGGTHAQIDAHLATAVKNGATASAPGPQVLEVTFTGPSRSIAQGTLESLISQLQGSMARYGQTFGQAAEAYYRSQVAAATTALSQTTAAAAAFAHEHPGVTAADNQNYATLVAAQQSATSQLATATSGLNQAIGQATGGGLSNTVSVIDPPSLPTAPTNGKKKALLEVGGGLLGGALISLLVMMAITTSREDRWNGETSDGEQAVRGWQPPGDEQFADFAHAKPRTTGEGKALESVPTQVDAKLPTFESAIGSTTVTLAPDRNRVFRTRRLVRRTIGSRDVL